MPFVLVRSSLWLAHNNQVNSNILFFCISFYLIPFWTFSGRMIHCTHTLTCSWSNWTCMKNVSVWCWNFWLKVWYFSKTNFVYCLRNSSHRTFGIFKISSYMNDGSIAHRTNTNALNSRRIAYGHATPTHMAIVWDCATWSLYVWVRKICLNCIRMAHKAFLWIMNFAQQTKRNPFR